MVAVYGMLCAIPPSDSNSQYVYFCEEALATNSHSAFMWSNFILNRERPSYTKEQENYIFVYFYRSVFR
jgi:hypothetical protein